MSRFAEPQDAAFRRLNDSIGFDWRLSPYDVDQSIAHAAMLAAQGIISEADGAELRRGLEQVRQELTDGTFPFADGDEDIHMAIERRLTEIVGRVGGRLHTARSRNDQVATDVAMFVRAHAHEAHRADRAASATRWWSWPSATSTGRCPATPTCSAPSRSTSATTCWPTSGCWCATRAASRPWCAATGRLPLGAGALAGVNFDTDRRAVAAALGFSGVAENSVDAVSNRDFVLDYLAAAATCATHLSRLGGEIVLWSTEEYGFCEVSDAWASGSSIMPQKKNPDAAELLRAKAPRLVSNLVALHGVMHGLPLTYNKDMQEDKEPLFDSSDTLELCLDAAAGHARRRSPSSASGWPRRRPTSSWPPPTSPTCWSGAACPSARPTGWSPGWCARPWSSASCSPT